MHLVYATLTGMKKVTLNFIIDGDRVLLAMKKRGFGEGKWNGVGGKVKDGESIEDAVIRETHEEIGVRVHPDDLEKVGLIHFTFLNKPDWNQECHVFISRKWGGEPIETEEMSPLWHTLDTVPYETMWPDDEHWLPLVLDGKRVKAAFYFTDTGGSFDRYEIAEWQE